MELGGVWRSLDRAWLFDTQLLDGTIFKDESLKIRQHVRSHQNSFRRDIPVIICHPIHS